MYGNAKYIAGKTFILVKYHRSLYGIHDFDIIYCNIINLLISVAFANYFDIDKNNATFITRKYKYNYMYSTGLRLFCKLFHKFNDEYFIKDFLLINKK